MTKVSTDDTEEASAVYASEFSWKGGQALGRVHALNERCLELLAQLARSEQARFNLAILNQNRKLWRSLNLAARRRASLTPYLLLDVQFQDIEWWRWAKAARAGGRRVVISQPAFSGKVAAELMRETLMLAWSTAAFDRGAAGVLLGMTPAVSATIAELGPQDVERITARHSPHLRPRWDDFPAFWGRLLTAALEDDEETLHAARLHGMQLLGSELLSRMDGRLSVRSSPHSSGPSTHREV